MKKYWLFLLALIIVFSGKVYADIYTWEDESGISHITDYPPPAGMKSRNVKVFETSAPPVQDGQSAKSEVKPVITLYTKNDCPDCDKAREYLNSKKVIFTEYNMDKDDAAAAKRKAIDNSSDVPFAIINRSQVYGFSDAVYDRALK
ncbi:MAG: glutaredoxin family protein [Deltaproteobacteria bacterium]